MDLALNNLKSLICHIIQLTNYHICTVIYTHIYLILYTTTPMCIIENKTTSSLICNSINVKSHYKFLPVEILM